MIAAFKSATSIPFLISKYESVSPDFGLLSLLLGTLSFKSVGKSPRVSTFRQCVALGLPNLRPLRRPSEKLSLRSVVGNYHDGRDVISQTLSIEKKKSQVQELVAEAGIFRTYHEVLDCYSKVQN